jgi:hypothetical protein
MEPNWSKLPNVTQRYQQAVSNQTYGTYFVLRDARDKGYTKEVARALGGYPFAKTFTPARCKCDDCMEQEKHVGGNQGQRISVIKAQMKLV